MNNKFFKRISLYIFILITFMLFSGFVSKNIIVLSNDVSSSIENRVADEMPKDADGEKNSSLQRALIFIGGSLASCALIFGNPITGFMTGEMSSKMKRLKKDMKREQDEKEYPDSLPHSMMSGTAEYKPLEQDDSDSEEPLSKTESLILFLKSLNPFVLILVFITLYVLLIFNHALLIVAISAIALIVRYSKGKIKPQRFWNVLNIEKKDNETNEEFQRRKTKYLVEEYSHLLKQDSATTPNEYNSDSFSDSSDSEFNFKNQNESNENFLNQNFSNQKDLEDS